MTEYEGRNANKATFVVQDCFFINCELGDLGELKAKAHSATR